MDTVDLTFKDFLEKFEDFGKCEWLTVYSNNREDEKESSGFYSALISRARIKKSLEDPSWDLHIGDGFPTIGFLPQSWSPNSDTEQFFDEENQKHYDLYNVSYLVLPIDKKPPQFARLIVKKGRFSLYKVDSESWFTLGKSSLEVMTKKNNLVNITYLWFYSPMFVNKDYPVIVLNNEKFAFVDRTIIMSDQNSYDDNRVIWRENPLFVNQKKFEQTLVNKVEKKLAQGYSVSFKLKNQCTNCILILKQTFHPNWQILVNGKKQAAFPVFPFYIGIRLNSPGDYQIIATYKPSTFKTILLVSGVLIFIFAFKKISKL